MKRNIKRLTLSGITTVMIVVALSAAYYIGYHNGYRACRRIVYFGRDVADMPVAAARPYEAGYDPYFTPVNAIPSKAR